MSDPSRFLSAMKGASFQEVPFAKSVTVFQVSVIPLGSYSTTRPSIIIVIFERYKSTTKIDR